ncbi:MAG TPA: transporter, Zip family protein [Caldithrix sp.]|nr:transporter, Zip family protein [Caldithrix sp.]
MESGLIDLAIYCAMIVLFAWIGGVIPLLFHKKIVIIQFFISFGAGILLGAALLHMVPGAAEYIGKRLGLPVLLGFLTLFILEKFIMTHPCPAEHCEYHTVGLTAFIGLSVHSVITGLALGSGILIPRLGFIVFLAVLLHKLPASLSLSSLLVKEHYSRNKIFLIILLFSVMVPLGAFSTYFLIQKASVHTLGVLAAFSAGTFLHVAADDLMPEVHQHFRYRKTRLLVFLLGLLVMWLVTILD